MMPFEKRLARLEAARNMCFQGRQVGVIFGADEASVSAGSISISARGEATKTQTSSITASWSKQASLARSLSP
jgi:hypothetical protein